MTIAIGIGIGALHWHCASSYMSYYSYTRYLYGYESESESQSFIWSLDLGAPTKTIAGRCREGHHKYRHNTIMLGDEYNR